MATIYNSEITREMIEKLALAPAEAPISSTIRGEVSPVFVVNETGRLYYGNSTSSANAIQISVPKGKVWKIILLGATYTSSATVGNRLVTLSIYNKAGSVAYWQLKESTQAASVAETYNYCETLSLGEQFAGQHTLPLPPSLVLDEEMFIKIWDTAAVDVADTMSMKWIIREYNKFNTQ